MRFSRLAAILLLILSLCCGRAAETAAGTGVTWDATLKRYDVQRGETNAFFTFHFANGLAQPLVVQAVRATCPCTLARWPFALPGSLEPGGAGQLEVNVDLRDRWESFQQLLTVETSVGTNRLTLLIQMPELTLREMNRLAAFADRQAVFKGDCARCHLTPAAGKPVREQYQVLCGTCHDSEHRGEMVPALAAVKRSSDPRYWETWVLRGKPGTFMPAFGKRWGGPLSEAQTKELITYLAGRFPPTTQPAAHK